MTAINLFVYHWFSPFVLNLLLLLPNQIIKSTYITATCEFCTLSFRQFLSGLVVSFFRGVYCFEFVCVLSLSSQPNGTERGLDSTSTETRNEHEMRKANNVKQPPTLWEQLPSGLSSTYSSTASLSLFRYIPLCLPVFSYSRTSLGRTLNGSSKFEG